MVTALFLFKGLNALIWLSYSYFYMFDQDKLLRSHGMGYDLASKEGKLAVSLMKSMGKIYYMFIAAMWVGGVTGGGGSAWMDVAVTRPICCYGPA